MPTQQERQLAIDKRKSYFAKSNFEENEKGYKRYIRLITEGTPEAYARENVKESFGWGDRRLDGVLETRAGAFSPKTASELEAKALVFVQRIDNNIASLCRHCDDQLDRLDNLGDLDSDSNAIWVDIEVIEETKWLKVAGKKAADKDTDMADMKTRTKRMTVAAAKRELMEAKLGYNQKLMDALKALKVDTIININAGQDISGYSAEDLQLMKDRQDKAREGRVVDAEYTVE